MGPNSIHVLTRLSPAAPMGSNPTSSPRAEGSTMWVLVWVSGKWENRHAHLTNTGIVLTKAPLVTWPLLFQDTQGKSFSWWRRLQKRLVSEGDSAGSLDSVMLRERATGRQSLRRTGDSELEDVQIGEKGGREKNPQEGSHAPLGSCYTVVSSACTSPTTGLWASYSASASVSSFIQ